MPEYAPTQDGFLYPAGPPWGGTGEFVDTAGSFLVLGTLGPAGLVFDVAQAEGFTAATLTLTEEVIAVGGGTLRLYLKPVASAALWSTANPPTVTGATLIASVVAGEAEIAVRVFTLDVAVLNAVAALSGWAGRFAFVLEFSAFAGGISRQYVALDGSPDGSRPTLSLVATEAEETMNGRLLSYVTPPRTTDLTTLATVKQEMIVSGSGEDAFLERLIDEASEDVEGRLGWKVSRAQVRESFAGNGDLRVRLTRRPLAELVSVTFDGVAVDLDDVTIASLDDAELILESGWTKTERPLWVVTYWGGWLLPGDAISDSTLTVVASDDSFNDPSLRMPLLVAGEWIVAGTEWASANQGTHQVVTRTSGKITTTSALTDESGGVAKTLNARTLPREIERACIELVKLGWHARDADARVKSEAIDDVKTSYGEAGASVDGRVGGLLLRWAIKPQSLAGASFVRS